ncbi:MAG: hypothetical protein KIS62_06525 [Ramlibacter sp.]|nr:hypothetical protein [Ramlibacter sp.]
MDSHLHADKTRPELTYSLHGLSEREMTLFKSFVRLLDHLTHQRWTCNQIDAQLRVVREGAASPPPAKDRPVLVLCSGTPTTPHAISYPIHADALERELNLLGDLIALHAPAAPRSTPAWSRQDLVHLSRWPTPELLNSRDRIRLATLMTGRPLTLRDIHERSGVEEDSCFEFVTVLANSGMLVRESSGLAPRQVSANHAAAIQAGLLSRIRSRLGLGLRTAG